MNPFPADWLQYPMTAAGLTLKAATAPNAQAVIDWMGPERTPPMCPNFLSMTAQLSQDLSKQIAKSKGNADRYAMVLVPTTGEVLIVIPDRTEAGDTFVFLVPADVVSEVCACLVVARVNVRECTTVQ